MERVIVCSPAEANAIEIAAALTAVEERAVIPTVHPSDLVPKGTAYVIDPQCSVDAGLVRRMVP